ncbi:hypothetical protein D3C83_332380 [compost metagenome]
MIEGISYIRNYRQAFADAQMTEMARSFYSDNKRVSSRAIKAALGIDLIYPTYREGLRAIHGQHA